MGFLIKPCKYPNHRFLILFNNVLLESHPILFSRITIPVLAKALKNVKQTHKIKIPVVLVGSPKESYKKIDLFIPIKTERKNQLALLDADA